MQDIITKLQQHDKSLQLFGVVPINMKTVVLLRGYAIIGVTAGVQSLFFG
jgi:hypothetical protein